MNVLSLFDGMSCGQIALERAGITVTNYYASEIDKPAIKVAKHNYPNTQHLGDVTKIRIPKGFKIDLLIGGSPCQGFSFAGRQLNFNDPRSKLFFEYVRLLKEIRRYNPDVKFMLENVVMKQEFQDVITEHLGVKPMFINSDLVSAQTRKRLYWTNIPDVSAPKDRNINLSDVLDVDFDFEIYVKTARKKPSNKKAGCLTGTAHAAGNHSQMDVIVKKGQDIPLTSTGRIDIHKGPFVRRYSVLECERLQTVPNGYLDLLSNSQAYKLLINGWTVDVIAHIFKGLK